MPKVYMSNISRHWPFPKQEKCLADVLAEATVYRDELKPAKRMGRDPALLEERAAMLRPTSRTRADTIYVASLAVLAWTPHDLTRVLTAAADRGAAFIVQDIGLTIPPNAEMAVIETAMADLARARRRAQTELGRFAGGKISGQIRVAASNAACERIAARWCLPTKDYPTEALLQEAGVSRNTATKYLGKRPEVQRKHRAGVATAVRSAKQAFAYDGPELPFVYLMRRSDGGWKVGFSADPAIRQRALRKNGVTFKISKVWQRKDAHRIEKMVHRLLRLRLDLKAEGQETFRAKRAEIIAAVEQAIRTADEGYAKSAKAVAKVAGANQCLKRQNCTHPICPVSTVCGARETAAVCA